MRQLPIFILIFLFFGCSVAKKNQKALNRVEADINLLNHAGNKWAKLNPCYPDTVRIGKTITVIDSSYAKENIDALNNTIAYLFSVISSNQNVNVDSLIEVTRKDVEKNCKPKTIYVYRTDTLPADRREIEFLEQKVADTKLENAVLKGEVAQQELQIDELKAEKRKTMWWTIGGGLLALIIIGFLAYILLKGRGK